MSTNEIPAAGVPITLDKRVEATSQEPARGKDYYASCTKAKKNAIDYEWPAYMARNPATLMANGRGQRCQRKDITADFADPAPAKALINTSMKFGMSKESPFTSQHTEMHPSTKAFGKRYVASLQAQMMPREMQDKVANLYDTNL